MSLTWMLPKSSTLLICLLYTSGFTAASAQAAPGALRFNPPHAKVVSSSWVYGQQIRGLVTFQERLDLEGELSLVYESGPVQYSAKAVPWAWLWAEDTVGGLSRQPRIRAESKELWVERAAPDWDLRIGNQILTWGAADVNPTDGWNARDLTDPFESPKLPVLVARLKLHPESLPDWNLELTGTPFFRESRLPVAWAASGTSALDLSSSRWLLALPSRLTADGLPVSVSYELGTPSYPSTYQVGARLTRARVGSWDLSAMAYTGVERVPRIAIARRGNPSDPALPIIVTLNPSFHREWIFGFDGQGTVSDDEVGLRFEAAYHYPDNSRASTLAEPMATDLRRSAYVHAIAGADYSFPGKFLGTTVYANIMLGLYEKVGAESKPGAQLVQGLPETNPWNRNLILLLEGRITEDTRLGISGTGSLRDGDGISTAFFRSQLTDGFRFGISGDLFFGRTSGFFGQFRDNRRARLELTAEF